MNCGAREDSWESLGWQGDQTSQSLMKSVLNIHWKDWSRNWNTNTLATWCKEQTHLKDPFLGKIEGGRRRWRQKISWLDGITDSVDWVWASSGIWWWTGKPDMLQSMGHKEPDMTVWLNWTEPLKWTELNWWNPYQRWYTLNTSYFNAGELSKSLHVALAAIETALSEGLVYVCIIPIFGTIMYEVKEEACHLLSC